MKVVILNGSPKGNYSTTIQTMLYLQKRYPQHDYQTIDIGKKIRQIEKQFAPVKEALEAAELIVFAYPVYTAIAPYQVHRFIELMKENEVNVSGKVATQFTTSKHFYDVTAHKYVEENCYDLNMHYITGLSADMEDLLSEKGRKEAEAFWEYVAFCMAGKNYEAPRIKQAPTKKPIYQASMASVPKDTSKQMVIITNCEADDINLKNMIADLQAVLPYPSKCINLLDFPFSGGCLGCLECAVGGKCVYKDGFEDFLRNDIQTNDAIIYAFTIKDHYTGSSFKCYDDRQFCNGHRAVTMGMPVGYLISGAYQNEPNLQMIVEARSEVGGNFLTYVATDEIDTAQAIRNLASRMTYAYEHKLSRPQNFYGVGGNKIFRDLIYLMRGMMKADHQFYKAHGSYDFPQKQKAKMLQMSIIGSLLQIPSVKKKMKGKMNQAIIGPYQKVIEGVERKES